MNLQRIVYLSETEYQSLVSNGSITKGGRTLTYDQNDLYITPSNDQIQFLPTESFPQIGDENTFYFDTTLSKLYIWKNSSGYIEQNVPIYTSVSQITNWESNTPTSLAVDANSPSLIVTAGTAASLTYTNTNVVSNLTTQARGE